MNVKIEILWFSEQRQNPRLLKGVQRPETNHSESVHCQVQSSDIHKKFSKFRIFRSSRLIFKDEDFPPDHRPYAHSPHDDFSLESFEAILALFGNTWTKSQTSKAFEDEYDPTNLRPSARSSDDNLGLGCVQDERLMEYTWSNLMEHTWPNAVENELSYHVENKWSNHVENTC